MSTQDPSSENPPPSTRSTKVRGWWRIITLGAVIAFLAYILLCLVSPFVSPVKPSSVRTKPFVTTALVECRDVPITASALGTVIPNRIVTVKSRVTGQVEKIYFREGEMTEVGQVLAQIDPRPFQAQLLQAQGQLIKDSALLDNAKLDLARYELLLKQNAIAQQQVDTQAALVRQYEGAVKVDQGAIKQAKLQLEYSRVTAPISGLLGLRRVDEGNMIEATDQMGLVVITQTHPSFVTFALPEKDLDTLLVLSQSSPPALVEVWDQDQAKCLATGVLEAMDNQVDVATGTIKLKARFNHGKALFPNRFVNVKLYVAQHKHAFVIPEAAVQNTKEGAFILSVDNFKRVKKKSIILGPVLDGYRIVKSGVVCREQIVVQGVDRLKEGDEVQIKVPPSALARE